MSREGSRRPRDRRRRSTICRCKNTMAKRKSPNVPKITERPLTAGERAELEDGIAKVVALVGLSSFDVDFDGGQKQVFEHVKKYARGKEAASGLSKDDLAFQLGCVWGELLRRKASWEWAVAGVGSDESFAIFPPKREFVILPVALMFNQLEMYAPTALLLYNMVAAGKLPPSDADARLPLM